MRYKQECNYLITGPGLKPEGVVAVGPAELEAAYQAGRDSRKSERLEIRCAHPSAKREYYGSTGWICDRKNGGCGATGSGDNGHYAPVIGYVQSTQSEGR